jgi:hypothetical protein
MDEFSRWKVEELKAYIKERGHKTTYKRKNELVAVAFAVREQNLPIVIADVSVNQVDLDYQSLCTFDCEGVTYTISDPWMVNDGWLFEGVGLPSWPPCSYRIAEYLVDHDERALLSRLANDYKEGVYCSVALLIIAGHETTSEYMGS